MTSPAAEAEIAGALARAALDEQVEEVEARRVPSLRDLKGIRAHLYITSHNATYTFFANIMKRSGLQVPENWVPGTPTPLSQVLQPRSPRYSNPPLCNQR